MDIQTIIRYVTEETEHITMKRISINQPLISAQLLDSMGLVDLALSLESRFHVTIDARNITPKNFETVENIASYLQTLLK